MVKKRQSLKKSSACKSTSKRREAQSSVAKKRKEARKKKQADFLKSDGIEFSTKAIIGEDGIEYVKVPYGTGFKKTMKSKVLARFEGKEVEKINALGGVRKVGKARNKYNGRKNLLFQKEMKKQQSIRQNVEQEEEYDEDPDLFNI